MSEKISVRKVATKKAEVKTPVEKPSKKTVKKSSLTVDIWDTSGKIVGSLELSEEVFGLKPNRSLLAQAVRVYLANQRLGTASTKGRGEVRGGGRKPWRQKGTGRARTGSIRDPHWRGGGVVHGPHPRDFSLEFPKAMRRKALAAALSDKVLEKELVVLKDIEFKGPKTKEGSTMLKNLNILGKHLIAAPSFKENENLVLRNLKETQLMRVADLNAYAVLNTKKLLITKEGVEEIEKLLTK